MFIYEDKKEAPTKNVSSKPGLQNRTVFRNATNVQRTFTKKVDPSDAVSKRKQELEQLKKRSLTKDGATRLKNAEAPSESTLDKFAERQRQKVRLEKEKLREARSFLNKYRDDGDKLSKFTESRRRSIELEKEQLEKARNYLNHYHDKELDTFTQRRRKSIMLEKEQLEQARNYLKHYHDKELDTFTQRRRKSLMLEKAKKQEAKEYLNNYRGDGILPTSPSPKAKDPLTPKKMSAPIVDTSPCETPTGWASRFFQKESKTNTEESRETYSDAPVSSLKRKLDCSQPLSTDVHEGKSCCVETNEISKNLAEKAFQQEAIPNSNKPTIEEKKNERGDSHLNFFASLFGLKSKADQNSRENDDSHFDFFAGLLGMDSPALLKHDVDMGSNNVFLGCNDKSTIPRKEESKDDPYNDDGDDDDGANPDNCAQPWERTNKRQRLI